MLRLVSKKTSQKRAELKLNNVLIKASEPRSIIILHRDLSALLTNHGIELDNKTDLYSDKYPVKRIDQPPSQNLD